MSARRVLAGGLATVAAAVGALASAPAALATNGSSTNATWAGGMPVTSANDPGYLWSNGGLNGLNWSAAAVPNATLNVLSFPDLPTCDGSTPPADACYTGYDDLGPIDVNKLSFGGSNSTSTSYNLYQQSGTNSSVTVEGDGMTPNVGLTGTPPTGSSNLSLGTFGIPIIINSAQQWNISGAGAQYGGGILYLDNIASTASQPLTLNLTQEATVEPVDVTTGPITVNGNGTLQLDYLAGSPERLPAVTLSGSDSALVIAAHGATSGDINMSGSSGNQFYILTNGINGAGLGSTEATLAVNGNVATNSTTTMEFDIDGNNTAAGTDSSELTDPAGTVSFGGAAISLWQAKNAGKCVTLTPGNTYTLISAHALSGQITVGGQAVSPGGSATETLQSNTNACSTGSSSTQTTTTATINYGSNKITATIAGTPPSSGGGQQPPSRAQIIADLKALGHPAGRKALRALLRHGTWSTRFKAPAAGTLSVTWNATVTTGRGKHRKHRTYVIARGTAHPAAAGSVLLTMTLTAEGKRLLREHLLGLRTTATERFETTGTGWITYTRRFTL